jgi:anti-sigma regulatory factor (Ser/Thr protein kinase)
MAFDLQQVFESVPASCPAARRFVADSLAPLVSQARLDDVRLATSEYATNTIEHTAGGPFTIGILIEPKHVTVHIVGSLPGETIPQVRPGVAHESEGGRGLPLVAATTDECAQLAARECGCTPDAAGWCCWFRINRPAHTPCEPPAEVTR